MATPPKYTKEEIEEAFKHECPYFYDLQSKVQATDNGQIQITVRKHKGKLTDYVVTVSNRYVVE